MARTGEVMPYLWTGETLRACLHREAALQPIGERHGMVDGFQEPVDSLHRELA